MDPAVSVPNDPKQRPAAAAAAEPPDDPPGIRSSTQGLCTGPKYVFGNDAIHTDERCGYSGEDPYAVSDFKVTHNNRSPSFSKTGEWQAWEQGEVGVVVRKAGAVTRITRLPQAIT